MPNPNGRPRGSPNKRSLRLQTKVDEKGVSPADVLLDEMWFHYNLAGQAMVKEPRDDKAVASHLAAARIPAREVAPYVHSKLTTVVLTGDEDGGPIQHSHSGLVGVVNADLAKLDDTELTQLYRATLAAPEEAE